MSDVTAFEKRIVRELKLNPQNEAEKKAVHTCALIASLGFDITREKYEHELKNAMSAPAHPVEEAYLLETSQPDVNDPRSEWERDWDEHCAETLATRESDRP